LIGTICQINGAFNIDPYGPGNILKEVINLGKLILRMKHKTERTETEKKGTFKLNGKDLFQRLQYFFWKLKSLIKSQKKEIHIKMKNPLKELLRYYSILDERRYRMFSSYD
jgi:hypothetical protein